MLRVGLTGGVASGKSTVARLLAEHGAAVCDADEVVRRLYLPGRRGAGAAAELFGDRVLTAAGGVDHAALAAVVLADAGARRRLEQAIHPLVRADVDAWVAALADRETPPAIAVVEAALLVETGSYRSYDCLVTVSAPVELRRARALACGWTAAAFERVVAAQTDDAAREAAADHVIRNQGGVVELRVAVGALWPLLLDRAVLRAAGKALPPRAPAAKR
jgi:dephospho-CoA kinase